MPKTIHSGERKIVHNVLNYLSVRKAEGLATISLDNITDLVVNMTVLQVLPVMTMTFLTLLIEASPGSQLRRKNSTEVNRPCTLVEFIPYAACYLDQYRLFCKGGIASEYLNLNQAHNITHLTLAQWPGECFNVGRLQQFFPELRSLSLINCSKLTHFSGHFDSRCKIENISLHGLTALWEIPGDTIAMMPHLKVLDLRSNVLRHMRARLLRGPPKLEKVYLGDNKWDCSDGGLDWLALEKENSTTKRLIVDYYKLMCHQQLYRGKPLHKVMDIIQMVHRTCPEPCACAMTHVVEDAAGAIIPLITVDCSNHQIEIPPEKLPPSTTTLRLEGNKINNIRMIVQNPDYQHLADLYLDNNSLPSVKELEGSEWFSTFRVLSLRGNILKQIPVYAFDKAFQSNSNIMQVFLGHNPWRCDCHFTPRFQTLLLKYKRIIIDLQDIRCAKSSDKKTSMVQISTMSLGAVCSSTVPRIPVNIINIVNIILAALILLVIGRFLYDWHNFKRTGKLPWISSILP